MFVFDPLTQGLELLANRELQKAETLFLKVINDPYVQSEDLARARTYLNDIRSCQTGIKTLDFDQYKTLSRKPAVSLDKIDDVLASVYFSACRTYAEFDREITAQTHSIVSRLKQIKIRDIGARDELFRKIEKSGIRVIKNELASHSHNGGSQPFDEERWNTVYRKFIDTINPILLERHLELLDHILVTGEIELLEDPKLTLLTPKYRWIIESTLKSKWYLLRSYFFKARSEIEGQFKKKEGTRKYWEEVKLKKIQLFEKCGFQEKNIQKFLYIDKLNYKTLHEIYEYARGLNLNLTPRDVSLALRGVQKAKDHIKERGGFLMGSRKKFQDRLIELGFDEQNAYQIARQAKKANNHQIAESYERALEVARQEIYWYRVPPQNEQLKRDIEEQCLQHLSTVRIHLFDRGRLNKLLLQNGKQLIRDYLIRVYGEEVVDLHCYFRLETVHQYFKLKFFQYHRDKLPSVSELIKISRKDFQPMIIEAFNTYVKKRRLHLPDSLMDDLARHASVTQWEDTCTTAEEKFLLRCWFLMDYGISVTQGMVQKEILNPGYDLWAYIKEPGQVCKI
ncbi:MAG: hypothetical protein GWM98_27275 [Nitrospinaceae bacterium]|nr:hypothetical protein [Nitrospinaceae bacterium]NIR57478.1 hypothetical protein [Nitrospinaceae bacterium]NIS87948.1 hypothetical protein [Nitrospinaceae bacterium]NIT84813.1 hypothetical protein [Nitrospinaceae bacterium]NIU46993.1 hypothetical protein [Nitrospinaceae bacterium]